MSVLSAFSKIFERLPNREMAPFIEPKLANIICGFRDRHSTQNALLRVIETIHRHIDQSGVCGMVSMDLSKVYDCLPYDLLLAKMEANGFSKGSLKFIVTLLGEGKE